MNQQFHYQVGQRWANTAEPELGMGIVTQTEGRMVTIYFPDSEATRTFSMQNAPLIRVQFRTGEAVENLDGEPYEVLQSHDEGGLLFYELKTADGETTTLPETQVVGSSEHAGPIERLLHGQTDRYKTFSLRYRTWDHQSEYAKSPLRGLMGPRVDLIPHQFHIAREVTQRMQPRVMLADEVGLGKTIEAGLITHRLLVQGQISRVLILVPTPLVNQWLVEMMRRFNLAFRIFNEEQCQAICESQDTDNPFEAEQLVLCSLPFLLDNPQWQEKALATEWDLLIVDEAHHLAWTPEKASPAYTMVETFSRLAKGMLLLTATPEKEGHQSHFAQLHLLDPARYHDLNAFIQQQESFEQVAEAAENLMAHHKVAEADLARLNELLPDDSSQTLIQQILKDDEASADASQHKIELANRLLDRQGTGRVLYRNTRDNITDFPIRELHEYPLTLPQAYLACDSWEEQLYPEHTMLDEDWVTIDPRVDWLLSFLKTNRGKKVLIICHHRETANALEKHLTLRGGVLCASFHEKLSIIERDRAAAWFAEEETGAQALICSEIGSEGRNFQFCHHLVLFDLPMPVDLLEQRIGRLDRIGQQQDIQIHALYFEDSLQERLFRWYDEGLNAFVKTSSTSSVVYNHLQQQFRELAEADLEAFIETTHKEAETLHEKFIHGRNRLLELHSQGDQSVEPVLEALQDLDYNDSLSHYMDHLFSQYGVESEELSAMVELIRPGTDLEENFPHLDEDGTSITYDRATALRRDEVQYLTWDHPMVHGAMEKVITGEKGKASVCLLKNKQLKEGTLLIELLFVIHCPAPARLSLNRYLPPVPIRILLDQQGRNLSTAVTLETLDKQLKNVKGELVAAIIKNYRSEIEASVKNGSSIAHEAFAQQQQQAMQAYQEQMTSEIERLQALQKTNPNIDPEEIDTLISNRDEGLRLMQDNARVSLDAIRVMVSVQS